MPRRMDYAILSPAAGSNAARLEDTVQKDLGKRHKGGRRDAYRIQGRGGIGVHGGGRCCGVGILVRALRDFG